MAMRILKKFRSKKDSHLWVRNINLPDVFRWLVENNIEFEIVEPLFNVTVLSIQNENDRLLFTLRWQ